MSKIDTIWAALILMKPISRSIFFSLKNGKIYAKDNQATRDALKRSGIDIEPDGEIKKQLTFYPEDDFRPDVTPKTVKPVEKKVKPKK